MSEHPHGENVGSLGVLHELPESVIAEIGEDQALTVARRFADRRAARLAATRNAIAELISEESLQQHGPRIDPDTGAELPPMRLYRFRYNAIRPEAG